MYLEYVEVIIKLHGKFLGKVRFEPGQGDDAYYIRRANILSKPYLFQDKKNLNLEFQVISQKYKERKLLETFIGTIN